MWGKGEEHVNIWKLLFLLCRRCHTLRVEEKCAPENVRHNVLIIVRVRIIVPVGKLKRSLESHRIVYCFATRTCCQDFNRSSRLQIEFLYRLIGLLFFPPHHRQPVSLV